jgi:hypothetical protein
MQHFIILAWGHMAPQSPRYVGLCVGICTNLYGMFFSVAITSHVIIPHSPPMLVPKWRLEDNMHMICGYSTYVNMTN